MSTVARTASPDGREGTGISSFFEFAGFSGALSGFFCFDAGLTVSGGILVWAPAELKPKPCNRGAKMSEIDFSHFPEWLRVSLGL